MPDALRGADVTLTTEDGPMPAYQVRPAGNEPVPGVVLCMDGGGLRDALRGMADRLAAAGYHVLVPELYHRVGPYLPFDVRTLFTDPAELERLKSLLAQVAVPTQLVDATACFEHLAAHPGVRGDRALVHGYCMGGRVAFNLACLLPDRVAVAASFHGGQIVTEAPDSPHRNAGRIRARVYIGWAQDDGSFTPENAATLEAALEAAGVRHRMERYHARHGFAVPGAPSFDAAAAEKHWERLLEVYAEGAAEI